LGNFRINFLKPFAPISQARWMGKLIYILKKYLLRNNLELEDDELGKMRLFLCFAIQFYVFRFLESPLSIESAKNDLDFLKVLQRTVTLEGIKRVGNQKRGRPMKGAKKPAILTLTTISDIAKVALDKMLEHTWYLSEENVGFAFFDERISTNERNEMVKNLKNGDYKFKIEHEMLVIKYDQIASLRIPDLVSKKTQAFFEILQINTSFFQKDAADWATDENYCNARDFVRQIHVVNDVAERGIGLIKGVLDTFAGKKEEDLQGRFLTVFYDRKDDSVLK